MSIGTEPFAHPLRHQRCLHATYVTWQFAQATSDQPVARTVPHLLRKHSKLGDEPSMFGMDEAAVAALMTDNAGNQQLLTASVS